MWRAAPADDDLRRDAIGLDADDSAWAEVDGARALAQPSRVRRPATARCCTAAASTLRRTDPEQRRWVTLDGIFYQADVWLDGAYLGDPEGYFFPHTFDITALSRIGDEHVVAIEVACPPQRSHRGRRNITGVFQHWDGIDRTWNPGGLWRPVRVYDTGPVRIDRFRVLCRDADESRGPRAAARPGSTATAAARVTLRTLVDGVVVAETERRLAGGLNEVNWTLDIGEPAAVVAALARRPAADRRSASRSIVDGELSDRRQRRTGLREVAWNDWMCSVNGERLFLKGANLLPDACRPRRRHAGRRAPRHRARGRRRARRAAGPRPHRHRATVRRRRRAGGAAAAGLPAAVGVRPIGPRRRRSPGAGRRSTCSATTRRSCSGRAHNDPAAVGDRARGRHDGEPGCATSPASSCRRGTRPCSTAG